MADRYASLKQGLVGCWIPSVSGSGLLLPDLSGRGNHGALTNMDASDWVSAQYGRALDFDGSNDEVRATTILESLSGDIFVSCWVNMSSVAQSDAAFITTRNVLTGAARNGFALYHRDGQGNNVTFEVVQNGTRTSAIHAISLNTNQWYFLYGYRRASTGQVVAGVADFGETVASTTTTATITHEVSPTLGGFRDWSRVSARIDDIRLYSRAFSEPEIRLLASRPGIGLQPSPTRFIARENKTGLRRKILTGQT